MFMCRRGSPVRDASNAAHERRAQAGHELLVYSIGCLGSGSWDSPCRWAGWARCYVRQTTPPAAASRRRYRGQRLRASRMRRIPALASVYTAPVAACSFFKMVYGYGGNTTDGRNGRALALLVLVAQLRTGGVHVHRHSATGCGAAAGSRSCGKTFVSATATWTFREPVVNM